MRGTIPKINLHLDTWILQKSKTIRVYPKISDASDELDPVDIACLKGERNKDEVPIQVQVFIGCYS